MVDQARQLPAALASRLQAVADVEGKIPRALVALGSFADGEVGLVDAPDGRLAGSLGDLGARIRHLSPSEPLRLDAAPGSLDALVFAWSGFRGVDLAALSEADRVLRPGGRLLVIHDYGRDEVSSLQAADAPQYARWSRRDGPFLRGGFRIRVLHCYWTFPSVEEARSFLAEAFGERGSVLGRAIRRPRLSWNVAVYHRAWAEGAEGPAAPGAAMTGEAMTGEASPVRVAS